MVIHCKNYEYLIVNIIFFVHTLLWYFEGKIITFINRYVKQFEFLRDTLLCLDETWLNYWRDCYHVCKACLRTNLNYAC